MIFQHAEDNNTTI